MIYLCARCKRQYRILDPARAAVTPCEACGGRLLLAPGQVAPGAMPGQPYQQGGMPMPGHGTPPPGHPASPTSNAPSQIVLEKGMKFKQYQIVGKLGQGGMGVVYRATDINLQRDAALKILPPAFADQNSEARDRFVREARSAASLIHQNIVTVFEAGEENGLLYIAMECIDGPSVNSLLKNKGPLEFKVALRIAKDAAQGLSFAHNMDLVHRDIKPDNILLHPMGMAKVADFGLAKSTTNDDSNLTGTGLIVGSPHYMSPEQCEGEKTDRRSDIYSLGVTLFHMITGEQPFKANSTMAILHKHVYDPVPDPRDILPEVPDGLADIVMRAMEKDKEDRYQTVDEMLEDMNSANLEESGTMSIESQEKEGGGSAGSSKIAISEIAEEMQEQLEDLDSELDDPLDDIEDEEEDIEDEEEGDQLTVFLAVLFILITVIGGTVFLGKDYLKKKFGQKKQSPTVAENTVLAPRVSKTTSIVPVIPQLKAEQEIAQTYRKSFSSSIQGIITVVNSSLVTALDTQGNLHYWDFLGEPLPIFNSKEKANTFAISPDGKKIVLAVGSTIRALNGPSNTIAFSFDSQHPVIMSINFNPSSGQLVTGGSDNKVRIFNPRDGKLLYVLEGHRAPVVNVQFSSNSKFIVSAAKDGEIILWDSYRRQIDRTVQFALRTARLMVYGSNFDHETIALVGQNRAWYLNLKKGPKPKEQELDIDDEVPTCMDFSWKSRYLAVGTQKGNLFMYHLPDMRRFRIHLYDESITSLAFAKGRINESRFLVSSSETGQVVINRMDLLTPNEDEQLDE